MNPRPFSIAWVGSGPLGYVQPYVRTQALAAPALSWMSTPTNCTVPAYVLASAARAGASSTQGPHHVAQKLTRTGRPCSWVRSVRNWSSGYVGRAVGLAGSDVPGIVGTEDVERTGCGDDVQAAVTSRAPTSAVRRIEGVRSRPICGDQQYGRTGRSAGGRDRTVGSEAAARIRRDGPPPADVRMSGRLDATTLRRAMALYARALEDHRDELDSLNVFPVPDGDTGTNMLLTQRAVARALEDAGPEELPELCERISRASLLGARGNSGVILSQVLRGACEALAAATSGDGPGGLAVALARGSEAASL